MEMLRKGWLGALGIAIAIWATGCGGDTGVDSGDEPSSSLTEEEAEALFTVVGELMFGGAWGEVRTGGSAVASLDAHRPGLGYSRGAVRSVSGMGAEDFSDLVRCSGGGEALTTGTIDFTFDVESGRMDFPIQATTVFSGCAETPFILDGSVNMEIRLTGDLDRLNVTGGWDGAIGWMLPGARGGICPVDVTIDGNIVTATGSASGGIRGIVCMQSVNISFSDIT